MHNPEEPYTLNQNSAGVNNASFSDREELDQLVRSGDYNHMAEVLGNNLRLNVLVQYEVEKIKAAYDKEQHLAEFLDEKDYEALALLKLLHPESFDHSIHTHEELRRAINAITLPDGRRLIDLILEELPNHNLRPLDKGAVMHDLGKLEIPNFVTDNRLDEQGWEVAFKNMPFPEQQRMLGLYADRHNLDIPTEVFLEQPSMLRYVEDSIAKDDKRKYNDLVPVKLILSPEQVKELSAKGFPPEKSFAETMAAHEQRTGNIIRAIGKNDPEYELAARLAESHHSGISELVKQYPASTTSLVLSNRFAVMAQVIKLADIKQAMKSRGRSYRGGPSTFAKKFNEIRTQVEAGKIIPYLAALWLEFELDEADRINASAEAAATGELPTAAEKQMIRHWADHQKFSENC
ncbi:hypothetical protein HGA34_00425 [Candidatus Falkowbacteria bacterium]|nr:hypothetical protein [Candidatus Falkowbacteria bacterium]